MSDTNNTPKGNPFKTIFKIWLVLELLWSLLIGTVFATGANFLGSAAGAGGAAKGLGTVALFIYGFFAGAFQGLVFSFIGGIACFMAIILWALFTGKLNGGNKPGSDSGSSSNRSGTEGY